MFSTRRCVVPALAALALATLGGCRTDEPVGERRTQTKTTIETPTEKKVITETHEKETRYNPPR